MIGLPARRGGGMPAGYDAEAAHKSEAGSRKQTLGARAAHLQSAANLKLNAQVLRGHHARHGNGQRRNQQGRPLARKGRRQRRAGAKAGPQEHISLAGGKLSESFATMPASVTHTKRRDTVGHSGETRRKNRPGSGGASGAKARRNEQMRMTTKLECRFSYILSLLSLGGIFAFF